MITVEYYCMLLLQKIRRDKHKETITKWFKKKGINFPDKEYVYINCNIATGEPHLITIGGNTTIAGGVHLITHDNSISKVLPNTTDVFGRITIGKNCFIGQNAIVMYGVSIADNVIVAAGSVVTKSINESNVIVAGNPAKIISTWDKFGEKLKPYTYNLWDISRNEMIQRTSNGEKLIKK